MKVSYIIPTHDRKDDLSEAIESIRAQGFDQQEIIVVSDRSTDGTRSLFSPGGKFDVEGIVFHYVDERIGAPKARNIGIELATGDVLVFVDDDIVLADSDVTGSIVEKFESNERMGVLALCIKNYYTGNIESDEFPHRTEPPKRVVAFQTTYFVGAGCAIRADALEESGYFPESFDPNRFEELDLSFRILDEGYDIWYEPSIVVRHKRSSEGRKPPKEMVRYDLENRVRTSVRNLPWRYVIVSTVLWSLLTLLRGRLDPRPVLRAFASVWRSRAELLDQRSTLSPETVRHLKEHSGRLYY